MSQVHDGHAKGDISVTKGDLNLAHQHKTPHDYHHVGLCNLFQCKMLLHPWTCNDFHNVLGLQETPSCLLHHTGLDFCCNVFVIDYGSLFLVKLVERELAELQESHCPGTDVSHMSCSMSLHLSNYFCDTWPR